VLRGVIARILDIPAYDPEKHNNHVITLHQFMAFFNHEDRINMAEYIEELAGESEYWYTRSCSDVCFLFRCVEI
jgi:hypothetical protein